MSGDKRFVVNIERPEFDQSTYVGRCRHFFRTTNPLNVFASAAQLEDARQQVMRHRARVAESGVQHLMLTQAERDAIWRAKALYDSAFHPDTGDKMPLVGRMAAQVPMNMMITGCMMTFFRTRPEVIFWQWVNQSFNALVNYTNRSGDSPISIATLATSYVAATGGALSTALTLNAIVQRGPATVPAVVARFVPFASVCTANVVNLPLMRSHELTSGVTVTTDDGEVIGQSRVAAATGISKVVASRILMAAPGMLGVPFVMQRLERRPFLTKYPRAAAPIQILLCGFVLTFATPMCCALCEQRASIAVSDLEPHLQAKVKAHPVWSKSVTHGYYNKGL